MSKESQIAEIAEIINDETHRIWVGRYAKQFAPHSKTVAEALHKARCRIIPKSSVIISAKKFEEFKKQSENHSRDVVGGAFNELDKLIDELEIGVFDIPYFLEMYADIKKTYTGKDKKVNRENRVDEMAKDICVSRLVCDVNSCKECWQHKNGCLYQEIAIALTRQGYIKTFTSEFASDEQKAYKEGYHKATHEVAKVIIEDIESRMQQSDEGSFSFPVITQEFIDKLKKKYEVEHNG